MIASNKQIVETLEWFMANQGKKIISLGEKLLEPYSKEDADAFKKSMDDYLFLNMMRLKYLNG